MEDKMSDLHSKQKLNLEAKQRIKAMAIGEPVTNVCAGDGNPQKHCYFVELVNRSHENRYGVTHKECWARCTDRKGKFWNTDIKVVYSGHLGKKECSELFEPVWQSEYGTR
jgi:hypothetical protein